MKIKEREMKHVLDFTVSRLVISLTRYYRVIISF